MSPAPCPICQTSAEDRFDIFTNNHAINCPRCGTYRIERVWAHRLRNQSLKFEARTAANASGYLRENQGYLVSKTDVSEGTGFLRNLRQPSVVERAMKLLRYIAGQLPNVGKPIQFPLPLDDRKVGGNPAFDDDILTSVTWSENEEETHFLRDQFLDKHLGFIRNGQITPAGWVALEEAATRTDESLAFVAMWFDDSLKPAFTEAIEPAIRDAGYKAERMDMEEHTDPIDDKMMADIRRAKFIVADLTAHRQNVYFEAGFALGLGKQVIWLIREDAKDDKSFDVRQYNFIYWKPDELPALRERLKNRILGSSGIGQGPLPNT